MIRMNVSMHPMEVFQQKTESLSRRDNICGKRGACFFFYPHASTHYFGNCTFAITLRTYQYAETIKIYLCILCYWSHIFY